MVKKKVFDSDLDSDEELQNAMQKEEEAVGEELPELTADGSSGSDDDAPEDVSFSTAKVSTLQKVQQALGQIQEEKKRQKLKRKERNDRYLDQKKKKLEALSNNRLPDDFLAKIAPSSSVVAEEKSEEVRLSGDSEQADVQSESDEEFHSGDDEDPASFLPLDKDHAPVVAKTIKDHSKQRQSSAQSAAEFRKQRLYGGKIPRQSVEVAQKKRQKKRARNI